MKIVIFGANGFLGRVLSSYFVERDYEVVAIARRREGCSPLAKFVYWDGVTAGDWTSELEGATAVINLAGRTVNCRYTDRHKQEIMESRVITTRLIGEAIQQAKNRPEVWINSSTATIYEHREQGTGNVAHTEAEGVIGDDFSMRVAKEWERAFYEHEVPVRKIAARTAIVLGAEKETVFDKLSGIVRLGLGGTMGSGRQMISWIHEEDFCGVMKFFIDKKDLEGSINVVAPHAETNRDFMQMLRKTWNVPFGLPATKWMLEIGTFLMRTETELVLKSRWVYPDRLLQAGYQFTFPDVPEALSDLKKRL